jgi:hypothetical protein
MALVLGLAALLISIAPRPAAAGVRFDFNLFAPPVLVPIPSSPVRYAPSVAGNYFFYGGSYYVFADDAWYTASAYDGPWVVVAPDFVPLPLLAVPVAYFHVRPHHWASWRHDRPPHWGGAYARRPHERREGGRGQRHGMGHAEHRRSRG